MFTCIYMHAEMQACTHIEAVIPGKAGLVNKAALVRSDAINPNSN